MPTSETFPSAVPQRRYADSLDEQLAQLANDAQLAEMNVSRRALGSDRYRPLYHYVNPQGPLNDPNGLCYWQGRYHLFYQAYPAADPRQHWGHAVSPDLATWQDLPLALYPGLEECCFSGSTLVEAERVIATYHGTRAGTMIATASDPLLLNWTKHPANPVIPLSKPDAAGRPYRVYDPFLWREAEGYYALSGTYWDGTIFRDCEMVQHLWFSQDLARWIYLGPLVTGGRFTRPGEDGAVPYFWPLGSQYLLLFASHQRGAQYLLGDYDPLQHHFAPRLHGRFNFGAITPGGVHAPCAMPDGQGGINVIYNINQALPTARWDQIMSLVRHLSLAADGTLAIEPVSSLVSLHGDLQERNGLSLESVTECVLAGVEGDTLELEMEITPGEAREITLAVLRSPDGAETTTLRWLRSGYLPTSWEGTIHTSDALVLDNSRSSLLKDVSPRPPEIAPFTLGASEPLHLRVFIDRSVVEVFANGRQALALRVYPSLAQSRGVSIMARGEGAVLQRLRAWQMKPCQRDWLGTV